LDNNPIKNIDNPYFFDINYLPNLKLISVTQTELAEDKINELVKIKQLLSECLEPETITKINEITNNEQSLMCSAVEEFKRYEIEDYHIHSPKDIYEKLSNYDEASLNFRKYLIEKYRAKLNGTKSDKRSSDKIINACNRSLPFLPDDLKNFIKELIEEAVQNRDENLFNQELEQQKNTDHIDYQSLALKYDTFLSENETEYADRIRSFIFEKKNEIVFKLNKSYNEQRIDDFLSCIENFYNMYCNFSKQFQPVKNDYLSCVKKVISFFQEAESSLNNYLINTKVNFSEDAKNKMYTHYEILEKISAKEREVTNIFRLNEESNFRARFERLTGKMCNFLGQCQQDLLNKIKFENAKNIFKFLLKRRDQN
jgi:hypothetical protein